MTNTHCSGPAIRIALLLAAGVVMAQGADRVEVKGVPGIKSPLAPLREVFSALGFKQTWAPATDTIRLTQAQGALSFVIGRPAAGYHDAATGRDRACELADVPHYVGATLHGPLTDLWTLAGLDYRVDSQTPLGVTYLVAGKRVVVNLLSERDKVNIDKATGSVVKLETTRGDISLELYDEKTPITVGSFLDLVGKGFYDGLTFHRVIANFMVQGGCPRGDGSGGPGFTIPDECNRGLKHQRGTLSMAKTPAPNSGGCQFFICHLPQPHLDGVHTVFGECLEGQDVVDAIRQGDVITRATILKRSELAAEAIEKATVARVPGDR